MRKGSIALSLFVFSAAWLIIALVATAFLLSELYSRALDRSLKDTLDFHVETLVGRILDADSPSSEEVSVSDPRFARPASGWYWAIRDGDGNVVNVSPSLTGTSPPALDGPFDARNARTATMSDQYGTRIRVVEREISVGGVPLSIVVSGSLDEILLLVDDFRGQALIVLGAVGVMLAMMSAIVARRALRPIGQLSAAIEKVRDGEAEAITGTYPREIAPVAEEVNELLRSNAQIVERARSQVGNLAHGLKTPLAVLRNEASTEASSLARVVLSESDKMAQLVATYLDRARLAARTTIVGKRADPTIVMLRLSRVMQKLHPEVTIAMARPDASLPWFRGDESDLEEMAGNLLDNACKWANGEVALSLAAERTGSDGNRMLLLRIEDNGPGLTEEEARQALRRGVRLDEKTPGSGLGLDIVKELVDVYGGTLQLKRSRLGGLLAELRLPAARLGGGMTKPA